MDAIVICIVGTYKQEKWPKHLARWRDLKFVDWAPCSSH